MNRILLILLLLPLSALHAQSFYRISADFSIKQKHGEKQSLQKGRVYYDINTHKLLYRMSFPSKEDWLSYNGTLYKAIMGKVLSKQSLPFPVELTIFHLALTGNLNSYGLSEKYFRIEKVEKDEGLVITTYAPTQAMVGFAGRLLISTKDKQLYGLVITDAKGKVISRQRYKDYIFINGIAFPGVIIEVVETKDGTGYKMTNYSNIKINETEHEDIYDYSYFEQ